MLERLGKYLVCGAMLLAVVSCGVMTRPIAPKPPMPADVGYTGAAEPLFYYTEGLKAARLYGDSKRALALFDKALSLDSTHTPSLYEAANTAMAENSELALSYSLKANKIDTANIWYRSQLGQMMVVTKNYSKALDIYEQLVEEAPGNPDNYRLLAALYEQNNKPFTAIGVLDSAEYKLGRIEELATFKRQLLINVKLFDKAIAETQALIRDYPYKSSNYVILAELYGASGKDSLAMDNYRQAQELEPDSFEILASLNDYYKKKGDNANFLATTKKIFRMDEVDLQTKIRVFNEITKDREFYRNNFLSISELASTLMIKYPSNYTALETYANHLIASGSMEQALELYKNQITDTTHNIKIFNNILDMEGFLNRSDSVAKYSEIALKFFPRNADLYLRKGAIASYMKRPKESMEAYKKALKYATTDSTRSVVLGIIGDLYHTQGQVNRGYKIYKVALGLWKDNSIVLNNYAYFLSEEGRDLENALKMAERVIELSGNHSTYLDTQAWILYKLGRYAEAKKIMQQAISLDLTDSNVLFVHYGDILYELGEYFMASVYWGKALDSGYNKEVIAEKMKLIEGK